MPFETKRYGRFETDQAVGNDAVFMIRERGDTCCWNEMIESTWAIVRVDSIQIQRMLDVVLMNVTFSSSVCK